MALNVKLIASLKSLLPRGQCLDPGACPGPDPGFAGVKLQETFYEIINIEYL
jgi:hypothetical protein